MLQKLFRFTAIVPFMAMLIASPSAEASRIQPIYTPDPIEVPAGKSANDVKSAVRKALTGLDFQVKDMGPGHMEATHVKHSRDMAHTAVLTIKYDTKAVHISYKDSKDLNYDQAKGEIHGTYNRWVQNVEKRIRSELGG
jgi:hypothetical protein